MGIGSNFPTVSWILPQFAELAQHTAISSFRLNIYSGRSKENPTSSLGHFRKAKLYMYIGSSLRRSCCLEHLIPYRVALNPQLLAHCSSFSRKIVIYLLLICSLSTAQLVLASWQRQFPPLCQVAANDRA